MGPFIAPARFQVTGTMFHLFSSLVFGLSVYVLLRWFGSTRNQSGYPPGPQPIPFIGNVHQVPKGEIFKTYSSWAKIYGPIVHFRIFRRRFIILNDLKTIDDLLVKRSSIYSTRPRLVMANELLGRDENGIAFLKYGQRLKDVRRIVTSWVNGSSLQEVYPIMKSYNMKYLNALLDKPDDCLTHVRFFLGSLVMKLTYGIECTSSDDRYITQTEEMNRITSKALAPGRWLCDDFPILAKIPSWMPFAYFRRWAIESRKLINEAILEPFETTRDSLLRFEPNNSWLAKMMHDSDGKPVTGRAAEDLWIAASAMYNGSIDSSTTIASTFFLMMLRHPEIQRKAQSEIDMVVGSDRLPVMKDKDALPYVNNILKESLRFASVIPVIPRSLDEDDVYMGYRIPKGTWVIANVWAVLHDPSVFKNPDEFRPERFEDSEDRPAEPDIVQSAFGFGRRACPGYQLALTNLFMTVAPVLSAFDIKRAINDNGEDEIPPVAYSDGHVRFLQPFKFRVIPRSLEKIELIRRREGVETEFL
ncbi:cytochrome P450 [Schizopora paradoxa]|uniref:Cytochrome P450 n=1 Tax=Schizopora paradoxa TaxID=27342 RepID=A0A0H2R439_9AGAM|nr:cytochrome P450 [Schizopora paradoxa]